MPQTYLLQKKVDKSTTESYFNEAVDYGYHVNVYTHIVIAFVHILSASLDTLSYHHFCLCQFYDCEQWH